MSKLGQLLSYLERADVSELVFRAGDRALLRAGSRSHPVTIAPLRPAQIRRFFEGTSVSGHLPGNDPGDGGMHRLEMLGKPYQVAITGEPNGFEVRVENAGAVDAPVSDKRPTVETTAASGASVLDRSSTTTPTAPSRAAVPLAQVQLQPRRRPTRREVPAIGRVPVSEREATRQPIIPEWDWSEPNLRDLAPPDPAPAVSPDAGTRRDLPAVTDEPSPRLEPTSPAPALAASPAEPGAPAFEADFGDSAPIILPALDEPEPEAPLGTTEMARISNPQIVPRLIEARRENASDVHLVSGQPMRVRKAGRLEPRGPAIDHETLLAVIEEILPARHRQQLNHVGYADLALEVPDAGRLRLNVCRQRTGVKLCLRLVASTPPTWQQLGLPGEVGKLLDQHQGLVVVSGPSGHGKTTSMAALVDLFNANRPLHVITVEDPVEVVHPRKRALMTQREVGTHTRSFHSALAAALREDPDIIAIGELRDRETVEMALAAAETGHLVLATMSTPSAAKTIDRLIDMFPPDDQAQVRATLSGALKLVISQRLLRRRDGQGLVAAYEMVTGNVPLWALIRDNKLFQLPSLMQRGRNFGMIRLEDSLRELLERGVVDRDEALLYAEDAGALEGRGRAERSGTSRPPGRY